MTVPSSVDVAIKTDATSMVMSGKSYPSISCAIFAQEDQDRSDVPGSGGSMREQRNPGIRSVRSEDAPNLRKGVPVNSHT